MRESTEHRRSSRHQVDHLAVDVVVGVAGHQIARGRRRASRPSRCRGRCTASVSSGSSGRRSRARRRARAPRSVGLDRAERAQNVFELPATNFFGLPNHCEAIRRAIGAAVSAPKPPSSTVTAITIGRLGVADVAHVPGLSPLPGAFGRAGLAVDGVLRPGSSPPTLPPRSRPARWRRRGCLPSRG